jgi:hypothetical protein
MYGYSVYGAFPWATLITYPVNLQVPPMHIPLMSATDKNISVDSIVSLNTVSLKVTENTISVNSITQPD